MAYSIGTLAGSGDHTQQQQWRDASPRKRRLYELIVSGFEHLLSQQGHIRIDGQGAGYVVWVPRREQYRLQQLHAYDGDAEGEEREDGSPVVLYGGGYDGLFSVRVYCCTAFSTQAKITRDVTRIAFGQRRFSRCVMYKFLLVVHRTTSCASKVLQTLSIPKLSRETE